MGGRSAVGGRRRLMALGFVTLLICGCTASWSTLGFGAARTGHNPIESKLAVGNVGGLAQAWSAALPADANESSPVIADGAAFVAAGTLSVFSADGTTGCSGQPRTCQPIWTATAGGETSPTVANHVVYTVSSTQLVAFDARGVTNCTGSPKTCSPLWTATIGANGGSPAVANGMVYVGSDRLYAFDAAGMAGCSGTPRTCTPQWTSAVRFAGIPAVADGVVYVSNSQSLSAFDASGTTGCTGTPGICSPLWTYQIDQAACGGSCDLSGTPSVDGGRVYITQRNCCSGAVSYSNVLAFDAAGQEGCSGAPKTCQPLVQGSSGSTLSFPRAPVALADGMAFSSDLSYLTAFATNGMSRLWQANNALSAPAIANGVAYIIGGQFEDAGGFSLQPRAYDSQGVAGCSGDPKTCTPLWTGPGTPPVDVTTILSHAFAEPVVANGLLYVRLNGLKAYTVP